MDNYEQSDRSEADASLLQRTDLRRRAAQARRLMTWLNTEDRNQLRKLAEELEARAAELEGT
jgi:hypothetical protein